MSEAPCLPSNPAVQRPRSRWQQEAESIAARIEARPKTSRLYRYRRVTRWLGRMWSGHEWATPESELREFNKRRGFLNYSKMTVGEVTKLLREEVVARQAEETARRGPLSPKRAAVVRRQAHRDLIHVLRGRPPTPAEVQAGQRGNIYTPYEQLTERQKRFFDAYAKPVRAMTDWILANRWTTPYLRRFGFANIEEVIRLKREGPGVYLRQLYKIGPKAILEEGDPRAKKPPRKVFDYEEVPVGPRIRGGQFLPRRGDEDHYVLVDARPKNRNQHRYHSFPDQASAERVAAAMHAELRKEWGDRIEQLIYVSGGFQSTRLKKEGILLPERDLEVLVLRTIMDSANNVASLRLLKQLADNVGHDVDPDPQGDAYRQIPESPAFGPLAGKWVPEQTAYGVLDSQRVYNHWAAQVAKIYQYAFNKAEVVWNVPTTWVRNLGSVVVSSVIDNNNPVSNFPRYLKALNLIRKRDALYLKLIREGELAVGWATDELRDLEQRWRADPDAPHKVVNDWVRAHPKVVAALAAAGGTIKGVDEALAGAFDLPDQVAKFASYLKKVEQGWTHEEAVRGLWMYPNPARVGKLARGLRRFAFGQSIGVTFGFEYIRIFGRALRERPVRMLSILGTLPVLNYIGGLLAGMDDDEWELVNADARRKNFIDRQFQVALPWRGPTGEPMFLNLKWWFPLAGDVDLFHPSGGLKIPFLFSQPWASVGFEMAANRDQYTGREIVPDDEKLGWLGKVPGGRMLLFAQFAVGKLTPIPNVLHRPGAQLGGVGRVFQAALGHSRESVWRALLAVGLGIDVKDPWVPRERVYKILAEHKKENRWAEMQRIMGLYNRLYREADEAYLSLGKVRSRPEPSP